MHNTNCPIVRSVALYRLVIRENEWRVETKEKWRVGVYKLHMRERDRQRQNACIFLTFLHFCILCYNICKGLFNISKWWKNSENIWQYCPPDSILPSWQYIAPRTEYVLCSMFTLQNSRQNDIFSRQASLARQVFLITPLHGARLKTGKKAYVKK